MIIIKINFCFPEFLSSMSHEYLATLTSGGLQYLDNQPDDEEDKSDKSKCLAQEHNGVSWPELKPGPGVQYTNH